MVSGRRKPRTGEERGQWQDGFLGHLLPEARDKRSFLGASVRLHLKSLCLGPSASLEAGAGKAWAPEVRGTGQAWHLGSPPGTVVAELPGRREACDLEGWGAGGTHLDLNSLQPLLLFGPQLSTL